MAQGTGKGVLAGMVQWVESDRVMREVSLGVKNAMRRIVSEYSFQREEGLRLLKKLVGELLSKGAEWHTDPFGDGKEEGIPVAERVLRAIFPKTLPPSVQHPMCFQTSTERGLAMTVLEGLCILSRREQQAFVDSRGVTTVLELFTEYRDAVGGGTWRDTADGSPAKDMVAVLCAALDTVLVSALDHAGSQHMVLDVELPDALLQMLPLDIDVDLKYKIVEFLSVLLRITQLEAPKERAGDSTSPFDRSHLPRGPRPPQDSLTPHDRLVAFLRPRLGGDMLCQLSNCVTIKCSPPMHGAPSVSTPVPIPGPANGGKRATARERDLVTQDALISHLSNAAQT
eukprot:TRINITY_DN4769_c0_g2_i1.p1 TRINITY_DN4769_c0_g2~~TRINITY_DN4769_c0_g2_i1.p1  ORF type:complete len:341 (+),score=90.30 TRINITY_DN4769_c0_g2_i1:757-1779(+)